MGRVGRYLISITRMHYIGVMLLYLDLQVAFYVETFQLGLGAWFMG